MRQWMGYHWLCWNTKCWIPTLPRNKMHLKYLLKIFVTFVLASIRAAPILQCISAADAIRQYYPQTDMDSRSHELQSSDHTVMESHCLQSPKGTHCRFWLPHKYRNVTMAWKRCPHYLLSVRGDWWSPLIKRQLCGTFMFSFLSA